MIEGYRTPTIDEFVTGFVYQEKLTKCSGYAIPDFQSEILEFPVQEEFSHWSNRMVPDYDEKEFTETFEDGSKMTWIKNPYIVGTKEDFLKSIDKKLKEGKIRCKK